ncbi:MAG: ATP-dependent DNA helicase RecG [Flavobacteriaceae bacterium]|nr:ATP-dependent DNA helicase RecG [Flavobacteriaceae bacterium]
MHLQKLQTSIVYLKGVGPQRADLLKKELGIFTYMDLLNFFPFRYIDKSKYYTIQQLYDSNTEVQIIGQITQIQTLGKGRGKRLVATFEDGSGSMDLVWFRNYKWIQEKLKMRTSYVVFGKTNRVQGRYSMPHPEMELESVHKEKINVPLQPVYSSTEKLQRSGLGNRVMNKMMLQLFEEIGKEFLETLPQYWMDRMQLMPKREALFNIHFPQNQELLVKAQYRLKFEELFYIQLQLVIKNAQHKAKVKGHYFEKVGELFNEFYETHLPFPLTGAQKRVVKELRQDMGTKAQMNRLLQGDVGSGKTIVAVLAMLLALDNGFQACLVAPTEILAQQHYEGIKELLAPLSIDLALLTGSTKAKERKGMFEDLLDGELTILIGTHAILEDKVQFKNLGLAIIDEQHRFGVAQRAKLWFKNTIPPHILVMTATPIPRTLAMSVYGDLDVSVIDELPPGRKPVTTVHRYDSNRLKVMAFMRDEIAKGRQVYIVYPLIEESEKMDYKDLMDGYTSIEREFPKPKYQISIVHGKMKPEDKDYEMQRFVNGETQIMVATTVIEVGVNVPNASVMVIESAERFGLSQLHQLRGRVGRGAEQSFCILMTSFKLSNDSKTRLETMVTTNDGFEIAEVDLKLRGPGDVMGTQQSGVLQLKIADVIKDNHLLKAARHYAIELLKSDPKLEQEKHAIIKYTYQQLVQHKNIWNYIS